VCDTFGMPEPVEPAPFPDPAVLNAEDRFVEAWGKMGSVWGISRTMAEVHALLYISGSPMCTDDIMARLQISRGNASMSLRALLDWGVVAKTHKRGDRKEYFAAEQDVWSLMRAIVRERIKREVDPLLVSLHEIRDDIASSKPSGAGASEAELKAAADRVQSMVEFFEMASKLGQRFAGPTGHGLQFAASILSKTPSFKKGSS